MEIETSQSKTIKCKCRGGWVSQVSVQNFKQTSNAIDDEAK